MHIEEHRIEKIHLGEVHIEEMHIEESNIGKCTSGQARMQTRAAIAPELTVLATVCTAEG